MKRHLRQIEPYIQLYRDDRTGIAWVENGQTGCGHSAHPNIDRTGSVRGMRERGYWPHPERAIRCGGFIYNVDRVVVSDGYDAIAQEACRCIGCRED